MCEYDLCGDDDFYKKNWTDSVRRHAGFFIYNRSFYGRTLFFLEKFPIRHMKQLHETHAREGMKGIFKKVLSKLRSLCIQSNAALWFGRELSGLLPTTTPVPSVEVSTDAFYQTLAWIQEQGKPWMANPREISVAIREKHLFANIKYNGHIVGYMKIGFNSVYINDFSMTLNFPSGVGYIYDTYIEPTSRKFGLGSLLLSHVLKTLKDAKYNKVLCHIPSWNAASLQLFKKDGFKELRKIVFLRLMWMKVLSYNPTKL